MRKTIILLLTAVLLSGCASRTSSPSASESPSPSASSKPAETMQTAPVAQSAEGVISDLNDSSFTLHTAEEDIQFIRSESMVMDGIIVTGTKVTVQYEMDNEDRIAAAISADSGVYELDGIITSYSSSGIAITAEKDGVRNEYTFQKEADCLEESGLDKGYYVSISYTGSLSTSPAAFYICSSDADNLTETVKGVISDEAMSTIEIRRFSDGDDLSLIKSDSLIISGTVSRGSEALVSAHYDSTVDSWYADSITVNNSPRTVSGTVTAIGMSTVTVSVSGTDVSFLKMDGCVSDEDISEGDTIQVNYEGELDGEPQAYALLKQ